MIKNYTVLHFGGAVDGLAVFVAAAAAAALVPAATVAALAADAAVAATGLSLAISAGAEGEGNAGKASAPVAAPPKDGTPPTSCKP